MGDKPRHTWNEAVVRWLKEQSHKATAAEDVTKLRWLDRHLGRKGPHHHQSRHDRPHHRSETCARCEQCHGKPNARIVARDSAQMRRRMGVAGPRAQDSDAEGAGAAHSLSEAGGSTAADRRVAGAFGSHGGVLARDRLTARRTSPAYSGRSGFGATSGVDSSRSGESAAGDTGSAQCGGGGAVRKQVGKHSTHVFSYQGKPIMQVSTKAWYAALERAGIEDFRWHDFRHTWASWHVQNGTPLFALQEMGGWESAGDGAALRAPRRGPLWRRLRSNWASRAVVQAKLRHKFVTVRKMKGPASLQALDLLVAGARFELATFGL